MEDWGPEEIETLNNSEIKINNQGYRNGKARIVYASQDENKIPLAIGVEKEGESQLHYSMSLDIVRHTDDNSLNLDSQKLIETFYKHPAVSKRQYHGHQNEKADPEQPVRQENLEKAANQILGEAETIRDVEQALTPDTDAEPERKPTNYF